MQSRVRASNTYLHPLAEHSEPFGYRPMGSERSQEKRETLVVPAIGCVSEGTRHRVTANSREWTGHGRAALRLACLSRI